MNHFLFAEGSAAKQANEAVEAAPDPCPLQNGSKGGRGVKSEDLHFWFPLVSIFPFVGKTETMELGPGPPTLPLKLGGILHGCCWETFEPFFSLIVA